MTIFRRHVRLWAAAWLVLQTASLSAFVPRDCCASHRAVARAQSCHETAPTAHCPMRGADSTPCAMHRASEPAEHQGHGTRQTGAHIHHDASGTGPDDRPAPEPRCVIAGTCQGPTFVALLSNPGVLPDEIVTTPQLAPADPAVVVRSRPLARLQPPDPRPPRA